MQDDESRLVGEARSGSREAFTALLREHQGRIRAYLGRFVRERSVVDDLAQETFLAAYRSLSGYRDEVPFRFWLLGIARNRALRHAREEQGRRTRALDRALAAWSCEAAPEPAEHDRELSALRACLDGLPDKSAQLVGAYYFRRRPAAEIARETGRKESAVWMMLLRIRQALRRCIESRTSAAEAGS